LVQESISPVFLAAPVGGASRIMVNRPGVAKRLGYPYKGLVYFGFLWVLSAAIKWLIQPNNNNK
jgi:hypothetical protein